MNSNPIHEKIKELYNQGLFGSMIPIRCTLTHMSFVPKLDNSDKMFQSFAEDLALLLKKGDVMTINPLNDELVKYEVSDYQEAVFLYIKDNCEVLVENLDQNNDIATSKVDVTLVLGNIVPFLDQEKVKIESASILTGPFVYKIEV